MTVLLVTPFAPYRDGIATYALQELRRLRESGETVDVCSPEPSAARWHLPLGTPGGMARLANLARRYDRTVIQFGPELAFGRCRSASQRVGVWLAVRALAGRHRLELRLHEIEYGPLDQNPLERRAARSALARAERVTVHTKAERDALDERVGLGRRIDVVEHGRDFRPAVRQSEAEAREVLGLDPSVYTFVAIGFLQRHKGFDLAVEAVDRLNGPSRSNSAQLHIVGSARVDHPEINGYVAELRGRCGEVVNATLHERYVSDVEFDLWLQAADAVVLPYREIWSSGVVERARLFETQIVASDLPQLRDQAPEDTLFFSGVDELSMVMDKLWAGSNRARRSAAEPAGSLGEEAVVSEPGWEVDPVEPDRSSLQRQIVERARSSAIGQMVASADADGKANGQALDRLLALGPMHRPAPTSARPGVAAMKRMVARATHWRIDPLSDRLDALQRATIEAVADLEAADKHNEKSS